MGALFADLRYSARRLRNKPGFTILVVALLAVGLGVNSALFSLYNGVLLRPLPGIDDPATLVMIGRAGRGGRFQASAYPDFRDYRNRNEVFSNMAAFAERPISLVARGGAAERVMGQFVSASYFPTIGVSPALGRLFLDADDSPDAEPAVVLSHHYWLRRFAADPSVIGAKVELNSHPATVVGVAEPDFRGLYLPAAMDVWVPIGLQPRLLPPNNFLVDRNAPWHRTIARLRPGVSLPQAQANVTAMARQLEEAHPESNRERTHTVAPYSTFGNPGGFARSRVFLAIPAAITSLVLIVVCANVANLLLARASSRRREVAVRMALGAGRFRIVRQALTEGLILAVAGAMGSLLLGVWGADFLVRFFPVDYGLPFTVDFSPDGRVLAYTAALALASTLAIGLLPALQTAHPGITLALKAGEASVLPRGNRLRSALTVVQVALSLVLLAGAGLLIRSVQMLRSMDHGMDTGNLLLVSASPETIGHKPAAARRYYSNVLARLTSSPGIASATAAHVIPLSGSGFTLGPVYGGAVPKDRAFRSDCNVVAMDYLATLGIPLLRGRDFAPSDLENSQKVVIVNESLARRLWPDSDPLGRQLFNASTPGEPRIVVGVAADSQYRDVMDKRDPFYYVPSAQSAVTSLSFHVRTFSEPMGAVTLVRSSAAAVDPGVPLYSIRTMRAIIDVSFWTQRLAGTLATVSGVLGMLMASLGLYGVLAYHVGQRTREIGLRMALGASSSSILGGVLRSGLRLAILGLLLGVALAIGATRVLSSLLYGVTPTDALTFLGASALLLTTTFAACWIPARRATRVDPIIALRYE